jgi:hypothetical protein
MEKRGERDGGQIEKMWRGDVRDSGHNRDMGGELGYCGDSLAKKDRTSTSKTAIRQGLYLHLYYIKREFVSSKNHLRTPKRGLIV